MSGGGSAGIPTKGKTVSQVDLDMTPVMNLLLILLLILIMMAVFTQIAIIRFSLPSTEGSEQAEAIAPSPTDQRELDLTLALTEEGFQLIGEGRKLAPIPKLPKGYNFPELSLLLKKTKREYPTAESIVLMVDTSVVYEDLISTMDICRDNLFPNVMLGGGEQ